MKKQFTRFFVIFLICCALFFGAFNGFEINYAFADADFSPVVYLGGNPLGIEIGTEGVIIVGTIGVVTDNGVKKPLENAGIQKGDILISVGGISVKSPDDISFALNKIKTKNIVLSFKRGDLRFDYTVTPVIDALTKERRLGLSVKDNISGIGTLTYITETNTFGALGHHIVDFETGVNNELNKGNIYDCNIYGIAKAGDNKAGELKGEFDKINPIGFINKNNEFGIFGTYSGDMSRYRKIQTASANEIKHGKAYIYTCINGNAPDYYSIDIIKTFVQMNPTPKSMVISVTDKRLIDKSGGIVQGMSGSPVIQNGKLIGAVTHVFVNDATKGYAIYIDWMLQN